MEVDFGESWVDIAGVPCKVKYLVATLPFSNAYFAKAYPVERLESLLDGIESAFRYFGGLVDRLVLDNTSLAVKDVLAGRDRQWRPLAEQAARQRQAPADYLAQLVHLEVTGRRERRIQRRIQDARFPMLKTLDAFSFEAQPDLDRDAVLQVFDCRFVAEAANIVFVGGVGTGKTHLSIALGMACCQHDYRVRFVTAAELVTLLVEAQQQGRLARKLAQLARFDLVICD